MLYSYALVKDHGGDPDRRWRTSHLLIGLMRNNLCEPLYGEGSCLRLEDYLYAQLGGRANLRVSKKNPALSISTFG